jgi:hypothetical protein
LWFLLARAHHQRHIVAAAAAAQFRILHYSAERNAQAVIRR